jgi:hypothetical protein
MRRAARLARRRRSSRVPFGLGSERRPPWRRWFAIIVIVLLALTAPLLVHAQGAPPDSVVLGWTESGDDGTAGTATLVEMRMSGSAITLANWGLATPVPGMPAPAPGGTPQRVVVRGLTPGATYYFALRSSDEAGNWSGLSNLVMWDGSVDATPPVPPNGLAAARAGSTVRLLWTPNAEPDLAGYSVYRATNASGPFTRMNDTLLVITQLDDTSLPAGTDAAWYRLTALDLSGNPSAMSPAVSVLLTAAAIVLKPAYPNPSPLTGDVRIPVLVSDSPAGARLDVLDSGGRRVRRLDLSTLSPGASEIVWDGRNDAGRLVAPGVYSAFLVGDGLAQVVRLVRVP